MAVSIYKFTEKLLTFINWIGFKRTGKNVVNPFISIMNPNAVEKLVLNYLKENILQYLYLFWFHLIN